MKNYKISIKIILISVICLNVGCNNNWRIKQAHGVKGIDEDLTKMIIINSSTGYILGSLYNDNYVQKGNLFTQQKAVIYKTNNNGDNWTNAILGNGVFIDACDMGDTIYALKNIYYGNRVDSIGASQIYYSIYGHSFKLLSQIPDQLQKIYFSNSKIGFLITYNDQHLFKKVYTTKDGGKTWMKTSFNLFNTNKFYCSSNGVLWSLTSKDISKMSYDILSQMRVDSEFEKKEKFSGFRVVSFTGDNNNLWFLGTDNNTKDILVIKRDPSGNYETIKRFNYKKGVAPELIYVFGAIIDVFQTTGPTQQQQYGMFPIGAYTSKLFRSEDMGKTWNIEKLPINNQIKPIAFYGKEEIWIYSGGQNLQIRSK